jgi:hypothetical protein
LAQSGHTTRADGCPLSGVKRTSKSTATTFVGDGLRVKKNLANTEPMGVLMIENEWDFDG